MPLSNIISFFGSPAEDEGLEERNLEFWRSLLRHVAPSAPLGKLRRYSM